MYDNIDSIWNAIDNDNGTVGLDPVDEHNGYPGLLGDIRGALRREPGENTVDRGDRVQRVLLSRPRAYRARVTAWADAEFAKRVGDVPSRLPIDEHKKAVRELRTRWAKPVAALLGQTTVNSRKRSHAPQDAHWHRWALLDNRSVKARSKGRKAWLKTYRAKRTPDSPQKLAEAKYYAKRKAVREAAKVLKGAA